MQLIREIICIQDKICGKLPKEDAAEIINSASEFIGVILDKKEERRGRKRRRLVVEIDDTPGEVEQDNSIQEGSSSAPQECILCCSADSDTMILPCGHIVMCKMCSYKLQNGGYTWSTLCPLCRVPYTSILRDE